MPEILFFPYLGPNRRADCRVVEIHLDFGSDDFSLFPGMVSDLRQQLVGAGILAEEEQYPESPLPRDQMARYSTLLAQTALLFQRKTGHRVEYFSVFCESGKNKCITLVEHEHSEVGQAAVKLASFLLSGQLDSLAARYRSFSEFSREHVLPLETEAIIKSARRRSIPVFQADRAPLAGHLDTGSSVRKNASLILGHAAASRFLDGLFCIDMAGDYLRAMRRNPDQRRTLLRQIGVTVARSEDGHRAESEQFCLLVINQNVTAIRVSVYGNHQVTGDVHTSLKDMCRVISEKVGFSPVAVSLTTPDISRSLTDAGGVVLDFDLAPDLDQLLGLCQNSSCLLKNAADELLDWLFPDNDAGRIPTIAVTGTNGKTTTSRMISHVMQHSGRKPGLVCTDGIYLNGRQVSHTDASAFIGHARVLSSKLIDVAVLESHHRGIAVRGFAFQNCDVAVCLNVTEEHLQQGEIETVEQMADIKRALLERASKAAVLFADDSNCVTMLDFIKADKICLISLQKDLGQLRKLAKNPADCFCVLEMKDDKEWIILYNAQQRLPVMPVAHVPATFDGTARFNVSNVMHAIAASYLAGIRLEAITDAMRCFVSGFETTPGRLNVVDDLPFRVIMDYAHNADGFRKLLEFVDGQAVSGRKILMIGYSDNRQDEDIKAAVTEMAGHFDHYICRNFHRLENRQAHEVPALIKSAFICAGISESNISVVPEPDKAVHHALGMAVPGDLVVLLVGSLEFQPVWRLLRGMAVLKNNPD